MIHYRLKHLNLSKNGIYSVPQLMLVEGRHVTQDFEESIRSQGKTPKSLGKSSSKTGGRSSKRSGRRSERSNKSRNNGSKASSRRQKVTEKQNTDLSSKQGMDNLVSQQMTTMTTMDDVSVPILTQQGTMATTTNTQITDNRDISNLSRDTTDVLDSVSPSNSRVEVNKPQSVNTNSNALVEEDEVLGSKPVNDGEETSTKQPDLAVLDEKEGNGLVDLDDMLEELNLDKIDQKVEQDIIEEKEVAEEERKKAEMMAEIEENYQVVYRVEQFI